MWYHKCPSRGKGCYNTELVERGGCAIWYNEPQVGLIILTIIRIHNMHMYTQYLADIESHLGVTIPEVSNSFQVPIDEYDGKIMYGEKKGKGGMAYEGHVAQLAPSVAQLAKMEQQAQTIFLGMQSGQQKWFA